MIKDKLVFVSLTIAILVNILLWIVLLIKFGFGAEAVPLHFNIVYGIDLVGESKQLFEIPAIGLVVILANYFLGKMFFEREKLFSYFLSFTSLLVQIIMLLSVVSLLRLVS